MEAKQQEMQKDCKKGGKTQRAPNFKLCILSFFLVGKQPQKLSQGGLLLSVSPV